MAELVWYQYTSQPAPRVARVTGCPAHPARAGKPERTKSASILRATAFCWFTRGRRPRRGRFVHHERVGWVCDGWIQSCARARTVRSDRRICRHVGRFAPVGSPCPGWVCGTSAISPQRCSSLISLCVCTLALPSSLYADTSAAAAAAAVTAGSLRSPIWVPQYGPGIFKIRPDLLLLRQRRRRQSRQLHLEYNHVEAVAPSAPTHPTPPVTTTTTTTTTTQQPPTGLAATLPTHNTTS